MKVLIKYHLRLGDIVRCLPIARHFARLGAKVWLECLPQYHGIFRAVSYALPLSPGHEEKDFDRVFDLQIWPDRFGCFRTCGKSWMDFVYGLDPEFAGIDRTIVFDRLDDAPDPHLHYQLPRHYFLLCPFGYSQTKIYPFIELREKAEYLAAEGQSIFVFCDKVWRKLLLDVKFPEKMILTADDLSHLPRLLRDAGTVMTINTAPAIIASAVRKSYLHISEPIAQDDWSPPNRILVEV